VSTSLVTHAAGVLGPPHRFCDQRCERCPLVAHCPAAHRVLHEPSASIVKDAARLRSSALLHATASLAALQAAVDRGRLEQEVAAEPIADAFAVAGRVGRVLAVRRSEVAAHLLAIEHLLARIDCAMAMHEAALRTDLGDAYRHTRWELGCKLEPLFRQVAAEHRVELAGLVRLGVAPSPFCSVERST
jgi:hypothetical protein